MALIKCPECGKKVSDQAPTCIHCGYPLRKSSPYKSTAAFPPEHDRFRPGYNAYEKPKNDSHKWISDPTDVEVVNVITIQKTSKTWKGLGCFGFIIFLLGTTMVIVAGIVIPNEFGTNSSLLTEFAAAVVLLGIAISIFARVMAWWHHG